DDDDALIAAEEALQTPSLHNFFLLSEQQQQRIERAKQRIHALEPLLHTLTLNDEEAAKLALAASEIAYRIFLATSPSTPITIGSNLEVSSISPIPPALTTPSAIASSFP